MSDDLLCRIEYYHDENPEKPTAWQAFRANWSGRDPIEEGYKTVGIDSLTFMQLRKYHDARWRTMKNAKHAMKWYADVTESLEQTLMGQFAAFRCNVVLTAHVSREKDEADGNMVYFPSAPGRLGPKGGGLPSGFAETYRAYIGENKKGNPIPLLQTQKDYKFNACTAIDAPDDCDPEYEALWENWKGKARPPLHLLVYGDAGSYKSRLLASFPTPMLICMFDPHGKDMPYLQMGEPQYIENDIPMARWSKNSGIYVQNILK